MCHQHGDYSVYLKTVLLLIYYYLVFLEKCLSNSGRGTGAGPSQVVPVLVICYRNVNGCLFSLLPSQVKQAVIWALQNGYRHIDCASIYGNEVEIGEALQETLGPGKVNQPTEQHFEACYRFPHQ